MRKMRFLKHHYSRTKLDYDSLNEMPIEELVNLRNTIKAFGLMWKDYHEFFVGIVEITTTHPDFNTLRMNKDMIPEVLDKINGMIGKRNMKAQQERRQKNDR